MLLLNLYHCFQSVLIKLIEHVLVCPFPSLCVLFNHMSDSYLCSSIVNSPVVLSERYRLFTHKIVQSDKVRILSYLLKHEDLKDDRFLLYKYT